MNDKHTPIDPCAISDNLIKLVSSGWMLITAGEIGAYNTMTASWGAFGELWNKKIAICFVRPTRYTFEFMERSEVFTLTFFAEKHRSILNYCGRVSGRDADKMSIPGLKPLPSAHNSVYFGEATLVLECRKLYCDDLRPGQFLDPLIESNYPKHDYHRFYIGEILTCMIQQPQGK
jgi:flavin reductase (DIM6/NTAB) family NADH-FMN oxidoreductase RutF